MKEMIKKLFSAVKEAIAKRFEKVRPECELIANSKFGDYTFQHLDAFISTASKEELDILIEKGDWFVKKYAALYADYEQLDILIKDTNPIVRASAASVCSMSQLHKMVRDVEEIVRAVVVKRTRQRDKYFCDDESINIRMYVAENTNDKVAIETLANDDSELVSSIIQRRNVFNDGAVV